MKARSDDPEVIESFADLLLQYGHGRTDAGRALALLEPAVKRFPYHIGLRFSLAHAHRVLGNHGAAEATCGEIVRRHPASTRGRCELAWIHERQGKLDQARAELEAASRMAPFDPDLRIMQARFLMRHDRHEEALGRIGEGLERMPEAVAFREMAIDVQFECGDEEGAVRTARAGIEVHPEGAYPWFLLADALNRARRFAA
ncbi:MAG TPA: tetratricopeptide repeat protein, partial [Leptolyngbyaceae cyanobacterium M65_K2018_010]|nr:tetratricopeptide repeat protein [Leptolyngbyaceae cyanobacterium M65_K2018_010]